MRAHPGRPDSLTEYFQAQQDARQLDFVLEMSMLKMQRKESVSSYFGRAQWLRHAVLETGAQLSLSGYKLRLTAGLTAEYDGLRNFLSKKMKDDAFTSAMLAARLTTKEQ